MIARFRTATTSALFRRSARSATASSAHLSRRGNSTVTSYSTTLAGYTALARKAADHPESFWLEAAQRIDWMQPPSTALDSSRAPVYQWFPDGVLNTCHNALDRHLETRASQTAIAYHSAVGGLSRRITYEELHRDVSRFAGALSSFGVHPGDRVLIYMPMVPEALVAMLACARIGAVHSVVFGGFAPNELAVRIADAEPAAIVTSSCGIEKGAVLHYLPMLDAALDLTTHAPRHIAVHQRTEAPEALEADLCARDTSRTRWHRLLQRDRVLGAARVRASEGVRSAVLAVHKWLDGKAQGRRARQHARRGVAVDDGPLHGPRAGRDLLGGVRYWLGGRALVHLLRASPPRVHDCAL
jgi:non-ribosomal peptide synthetase component F